MKRADLDREVIVPLPSKEERIAKAAKALHDSLTEQFADEELVGRMVTAAMPSICTEIVRPVLIQTTVKGSASELFEEVQKAGDSPRWWPFGAR